MRLVHESKDDLGIAFVFGGQLGPEVCELGICWSTRGLANDLTIEPCKVVNVDYTIRASEEAGLHQLIVFPEIGGIQGGS